LCRQSSVDPPFRCPECHRHYLGFYVSKRVKVYLAVFGVFLLVVTAFGGGILMVVLLLRLFS
jgi:hypothetical protein